MNTVRWGIVRGRKCPTRYRRGKCPGETFLEESVRSPKGAPVQSN